LEGNVSDVRFESLFHFFEFETLNSNEIVEIDVESFGLAKDQNV
jgi:hypothetical protein